jgi:Trypsin
VNELAVTHMRATLLVSVIAAAFTADMNAIVIRQDRDEARYRALGQDTPAVVRFAAGGMGTLIAAQWILTAAHVAEHLNVGASVNVDGVIRRVTAVTSHPEYSMQKGADIALVRLDAAIQARPIPLHTGRDETGKTVTFIGEGDFGTGLTGPVHRDFVRRGAHNRVARVTDGWLIFTFDPWRTRKTSKASAVRATAAVPPCSPAMG